MRNIYFLPVRIMERSTIGQFSALMALHSMARQKTSRKSRAVGKRQAENLSQTRREHANEIAEDYVEAIADLVAELGEARVVDLAKCLGVTHVTVNRTIARLQAAGLVTSQPYRAIFLTEKGRALAVACKSRHETVVDFLRGLGIPERVAEMDAEGIEHHVSPETLAAFKRHTTARP
jgi:DtxR family manganese transport transcriptional regulator